MERLLDGKVLNLRWVISVLKWKKKMEWRELKEKENVNLKLTHT